MKNHGGIIRSVTVLVCSAIMLGYIGYNAFLFDFEAVTIEKTENTSSDYEKTDTESRVTASVSSDTSKQESSSSSAEKTESQESRETAATGTALGKITEKHISPYSAGLSYNNVYLKNSTGLKINLKSLLNEKLKYTVKKNSEPQILIMHTHTTESFMTENRDYYTSSDKSRRTDNSLNMVHLGDIVAKKLNSAGIKTLHDTTKHDYPSYNGSYSRAAETICGYLKKYPSIKIVIDMHRDAISSGKSDKVKITSEINGKKAAQIMLVMGSQSGTVTNFPNWKENLKLAVRLHQAIEVMYPSLARPISLCSKNYNESLTNGSLLIEMGTDANTIEEVSYSAELLGNALVSLMNTLS